MIILSMHLKENNFSCWVKLIGVIEHKHVMELSNCVRSGKGGFVSGAFRVKSSHLK